MTDNPGQISPTPSLPPLWRSRDFLLLWSGAMVSSIGSQASGLAMPLLTLALTHSAQMAGLIAAVRGIPYALLSLPAGALADRWDKKRVMVICEAGRALALASVPVMALLGHISLAILATATLIEGTLFVFYNMTETTCLSRVVPPSQLPVATAQFQAMEAASGLLGPSLGGFLFGIGRTVPFAVDAVSYAVSALSAFFIKTPLAAAPRDMDQPPTHLWAEILEGLRWLWADHTIRFVALLTGGLCLSGAGWMLLLVIRAQEMHASPAQIGLLTASGGVGTLLGAACSVPLQRWLRFGPLMIWATWALVLTWPLYAAAHTLLTLGMVNAVLFFAVPVYFSTQYAYRLGKIPDHLQGRVNSVFRLIAFGSVPLGEALSGFLIQRIGPIETIWWTFLPQVILAIIATFYRPLRRAS